MGKEMEWWGLEDWFTYWSLGENQSRRESVLPYPFTSTKTYLGMTDSSRL